MSDASNRGLPVPPTVVLERASRAEREREGRETAARNRRTSVRIGTAGLFLLFLGAIGTLVVPAGANVLIVVMVAGLVLIVAALLLVRTSAGGIVRLRGLTKIL